MMRVMLLRHEISYAAPLADVFAMLSDPDFRQASATAMGVISADVVITPNDEGISVRIDQVQPTEGVPSFAKKFAGDSARAITTQVWSGSTASYQVETPGKPTGIKGTASVTASGTGSVLLYDLEVKASVPLIGGKLEKLMVELTTEGFDKEQTVGAAWLAGER